MKDSELELLLYRIISGKTYFIYNDEEYCSYSPSKDIKYRSLILYNNIINEEKFTEWTREDNVNNFMIFTGIWSKETDQIISNLENSIDDLKVELYKTFFAPSLQVKIRKNLSSLRKQLNKLLFTKQEFISHTLEGYANNIRNEYIICNTLYKDNKLIFNDKNPGANQSYSYFNNIVSELDRLIITTDNYKALARSGQWRSYWGINKGTNFI